MIARSDRQPRTSVRPLSTSTGYVPLCVRRQTTLTVPAAPATRIARAVTVSRAASQSTTSLSPALMPVVVASVSTAGPLAATVVLDVVAATADELTFAWMTV